MTEIQSVSFMSGHTEELSIDDNILSFLQDLITRESEVKSVSTNIQNERIWKILVEEQLSRSSRLGVSPQCAFRLNGPDTVGFDACIVAWGGRVHIPWEGFAAGDLIISLRKVSGLVGSAIWHYYLTTSPPEQNPDGKLYKHVESIGKWHLYKSNYHYEPVYLLDQRMHRNSLEP